MNAIIRIHRILSMTEIVFLQMYYLLYHEWFAGVRRSNALSTTEAKYIVASSTACQAIWIREILAELQQSQEGATRVILW